MGIETALEAQIVVFVMGSAGAILGLLAIFLGYKNRVTASKASAPVIRPQFPAILATSPTPTIETGFVLAQDIAEAKSGQPIIPRAFEWAPQGSRILVVVDLVPEKIGMIHLSEDQQDMQQMGTGYIISCGPTAGLLPNNQIGQIAVSTPELLLGRHVMFGFHSGKAVRFSVFDSDYDSKLLLLAPLDIWMLDQNPEPFQFDKEYEEAYVMTKQGIEDAAGEALEVDRQLLVRTNELAFDKEREDG